MSTTDSVELAFKYGPFCFAVLLVAAALRLVKKGGPSKGLVYLFALSGILFMAVSAQWWLKRPAIHVFEGTLRDLKAYERLSSDDETFFYREEPKTKMGDDDEQLRNVRFAVVKEGDFGPGDSFAVEYRKDGGQRERFRIPYSFGKAPEFIISWDAATQKNILRSAPTVALRLPTRIFERMAFAEEAGPNGPVERARDPFPPTSPSSTAALPAANRPPAPPAPATTAHKPASAAAVVRPRPTLSPEAAGLVAILQDSRSEVGAKIAALDRLLTYDAVGIGVLMQAATDAGPVPGTLLNLSRHSDPELASKARTLLERGGDLTSIVIKDLTSRDPVARANAREVVQSMDKMQADQVLDPLPAGERKSLAPPPMGQPLPTGSRSGDRYYVKATWEPRTKPVVTCLTTFYNGFLLSNRSLGDEQRLMQGRNTRLVYGFSREQALYAAEQIRGCGGNPSFVVPGKIGATGD